MGEVINNWHSIGIAQGSFPWQPMLMLYRRNWPIPPSFATLAFKGFIATQTDALTTVSASGINLVNFSPVTPVCTRLECVYRVDKFAKKIGTFDKSIQNVLDRFLPNFQDRSYEWE